MGKATIQLDGVEIETELGNCSARGVRVIVPAALAPEKVPEANDTILVRMLLATRWFTGVCIYATSEQDGSVCIGIFFPNPYEQNHIQHWLYKALKPGR